MGLPCQLCPKEMGKRGMCNENLVLCSRALYEEYSCSPSKNIDPVMHRGCVKTNRGAPGSPIQSKSLNNACIGQLTASLDFISQL